MKDTGRYTRRGAAYLIALLAGTIVTVTGLSALSMATSRAKESVLSGQSARARLLAQSAFEHGLGALAANFDDGKKRADLSTSFTKALSLDNGQLEWSLGEIDGSSIDNTDGPIVLRAEATYGQAKHAIQGVLPPSGEPFDVLATAMYAGKDITLSSLSSLTADQLVGTKESISATGATFDAPAEAVKNITGALYLGSTTPSAPERAQPNPGNTIDYHVALGTRINLSSLPVISSARTLENVLLSPTSNPFGSPNPLGIYVIDLDSNRFHLRNVRIKGTLILLKSTPDSIIGANVLMQPAHPWLPPLLVDEYVTFMGNGLGPNEALIGVNLNPPGTPFEFEHDSALDDVYPGRIDGVVFVGKDISFNLVSQAFRGTVVAGEFIRIRTSAKVIIEYDPSVAHIPPFGFFDDSDGELSLDPSTIEWRLP